MMCKRHQLLHKKQKVKRRNNRSYKNYKNNILEDRCHLREKVKKKMNNMAAKNSQRIMRATKAG
jgi:hypothetical protein